MNADALHGRLEELAADVGRLRRRVEPESSLAFSLDRVAGHVESLAWILVEPTAAELVLCTYPGNDEALAAALEHVDRRHAHWRRLLGFGEAA